MANKSKRIEMLIRKNVSEILQFEVKNSGIGFVTVTDCKLSNDYQNCKIYVSFLGSKNPEKNLEALNNAKGFIRTSLSKKMDIWKIPQLIFVLDNSIDEQIHMSKLLKDEEKELEKMKK